MLTKNSPLSGIFRRHSANTVEVSGWLMADDFGNPEKEHHMWAFVEGVRGVAETCKGYHLKEYPDSPIPIIAGNVSFYNESKDKPIPPSPMISCLGKIADVSKSITPEFKQIDSVLLIVGERKNE